MSPSRVVTIVQARMGSTRLPGKVLADLLGKPLLERQLERLARARTPHETVIATTTLPRDTPVAELAARVGVACFRGDERDVLARFAGAAARHAADVVVRVTADCPLLDPDVLDRCVGTLLEGDRLEYVANVFPRTYPRGLDVEALTRETLAIADREAHEPLDREHVTRYVWQRPHRFRLANVADTADHSHLRWTVDAPEDLALVRAIYADLYPRDPAFGYAAALRHAAEHPALHATNAAVEQKTV
jgi:spore coat polysaccharide biosynthesis protein SpsF